MSRSPARPSHWLQQIFQGGHVLVEQSLRDPVLRRPFRIQLFVPLLHQLRLPTPQPTFDPKQSRQCCCHQEIAMVWIIVLLYAHPAEAFSRPTYPVVMAWRTAYLDVGINVRVLESIDARNERQTCACTERTMPERSA